MYVNLKVRMVRSPFHTRTDISKQSRYIQMEDAIHDSGKEIFYA
jgi:hypothetical protein